MENKIKNYQLKHFLITKFKNMIKEFRLIHVKFIKSKLTRMFKNFKISPNEENYLLNQTAMIMT
jgi:hypothetical protein